MKENESEALHIILAQQVFINELLLMIDYDMDFKGKRKYDGWIKSKQEERERMRQAIDSFALKLKE